MPKQSFLKLLILIAMLAASPAAFSHAKYVSTNPAPRSVVTRSPESIRILFTQQLEPTYSTIVVKSSNGLLVSANKAVVDPTNNKRLILSLPHLKPGKYTVIYKILSLDGHVIDSSYKFRIKENEPISN